MRQRRLRPFRDRVDAGRQLAGALAGRLGPDPVVLGLPRGGVPVAAEIARAHRAPLDVLVVRKVGDPYRPEYALAALGEEGVLVHNPAAVGDVPERVLADLVVREAAVVADRVAMFRPDDRRVDLSGRDVVVVDDGVATGSTAAAALQVVAVHGPASLTLAVPVASPRTLAWLEQWCDEAVALLTPEAFSAVGEWYEDFTPTSTEEVQHILTRRDEHGRLP